MNGLFGDDELKKEPIHNNTRSVFTPRKRFGADKKVDLNNDKKINDDNEKIDKKDKNLSDF